MKKKKKSNHKIRNITLDILEFLLLIPASIADGFVSQDDFYNKYKDTSTLSGEISDYIASLKQSGYVESKTVQGEKCLKLTNKAKLRLLDRVSKTITNDTKLRFVSFDIPEKMRVNRNKFRNALKKLGMIKIQNSLWVVDKNISEYLELISYEYKVEKYVAYIISEKTDIDGLIYKMLDKSKKSKFKY